MATNFPTSLDTFTNPNSGNTLDSPSHSVQHSDINDAVEAIEAKLGVGSSTAGSATAGYALVNTSGGTTAYSLLGVAGLSSGTADANTVLTADGSGGATFSPPSSSGLTLLSTISFSAVNNQAVNPFSATYDAYKIVFTLTAASGDPTMTFRIRDGVTDLSGADYYYGGIENKTDSGTVGTNRGNAATAFGLSNLSSAQAARYFVLLDVVNPFATTATKISYQGFVGSAAGFFTFVGTGIVANSTSYNGYNIIASTGTITGKVVTYGYSL